MDDAEYLDALRLVDRAVKLLDAADAASRADLLYDLRQLRIAFDVLRVQIGQPAPDLQRN